MAYIVSISLVLIIIGSWILWKSGFLRDAESPKKILDRPLMDKKERRAFLKRLTRWKQEGKLTRAEFERMQELCDQEWD